MALNNDGDAELSPLERIPAEIRNRIFALAVLKDKDLHISSAKYRQPALAFANNNIRKQVLPIFLGGNTFVLNTFDTTYGFYAKNDVGAEELVKQYGEYLKFMKDVGAYHPTPPLGCHNDRILQGGDEPHHRINDYDDPPQCCDLICLYVNIRDNGSISVEFTSHWQFVVPLCVCNIMSTVKNKSDGESPEMFVGRLMLATLDDLEAKMHHEIDEDLKAAIDRECEDGDITTNAHDLAWATGGCGDCKEFRTCVKYDGYDRPEAESVEAHEGEMEGVESNESS